MQELVKGKGRSPLLAAREGPNTVLVKLSWFGKVWQLLLPFALARLDLSEETEREFLVCESEGDSGLR